jgi:hypothetical protein
MGILVVVEMMLESKSEQCKVRAALIHLGCEETIRSRRSFPSALQDQ